MSCFLRIKCSLSLSKSGTLFNIIGGALILFVIKILYFSMKTHHEWHETDQYNNTAYLIALTLGSFIKFPN